MRRAAREYRQCFREGNVAIYLAKGPGSRVEYETIEIQVLAAGQVDGRNYPDRESFPPSAAWGKLGFTYSDRSHKDPEAAALIKAHQLISGRAK
jgi:hypothetical protein